MRRLGPNGRAGEHRGRALLFRARFDGQVEIRSRRSEYKELTRPAADEDAVFDSPVARLLRMGFPAGEVLVVEERHERVANKTPSTSGRGSGRRQFLDLDSAKFGDGLRLRQ